MDIPDGLFGAPAPGPAVRAQWPGSLAWNAEGSLIDALWGQCSPPPLDGDVVLVGRWSPAGAAELTRSRRALAAALAAEESTGQVTAGAVERLLLVFEETGSNAVRHGRPPVQITVTRSAVHWLVQVSDAAADVAPTPAVDRDAALGGLGLYVVARVCGAHGWFVEGGRKTVWARIDHSISEAPPEVVGALPKPRLAATRAQQACR
jgi:Histidine kinase-like ATPase domain